MKFSSIAGGLLTLALVLAGCEQPTQTKTEATYKSLTLTSDSTYKFYDLTTGAEVSSDDSDTQNWDVAVSSSTGGIRTNSGASATLYGSSGQGGVYYSGSTDFDSVKTYDITGFDEDYATDTSRWTATNTGPGGIIKAQSYLNQITKLDYSAGDGLAEATAFENDASAGVYDGEAYFVYSGGEYTTSNEVYIIRHGDGTHYSKFQITSMTGSSSSRVRVIKYASF